MRLIQFTCFSLLLVALVSAQAPPASQAPASSSPAPAKQNPLDSAQAANMPGAAGANAMRAPNGIGGMPGLSMGGGMAPSQAQSQGPVGQPGQPEPTASSGVSGGSKGPVTPGAPATPGLGSMLANNPAAPAGLQQGLGGGGAGVSSALPSSTTTITPLSNNTNTTTTSTFSAPPTATTTVYIDPVLMAKSAASGVPLWSRGLLLILMHMTMFMYQ